MRLLLIAICVTTWPTPAHGGLAPPHPDFVGYENVHQYRRRLNITYGYEPQHLHDEECRYLTEEECRHHDEQLADHRRLRRLNPAIGKYKALVLLIRFADHKDRQLSSREWIEEVFNGEGPSEANPVGSIKEWLYYQSLGQYEVEFHVEDWDTAPESEAYYAGGFAGKRGPLLMQEVFAWKMQKMDEAGFNWREFDANDDYVIDHLVVLHSGLPAEHGDISCHDHFLDRIWSQGSAGPAHGWYSTNADADNWGMEPGGYALTSALGVKGLCEDPPFDMGMASHEMMHGFGVVDLYDNDRKGDVAIRVGGISSFGVMASAYGWRRDARICGHLSAFTRIAAGWITADEITRNGYYAIQPTEISGQAYKLSVGLPEGEYFLIENKACIKWSIDCPNGGIVIMHVDEAAPLQAARSWPGKEGWPVDHYRVAVVQADGQFELEKGISLGSDEDFFRKGMVVASIDESQPNLNGYQGGRIIKTGVKITILTDPGYIMLFKVEGIPGGGGFAPGLTPVDSYGDATGQLPPDFQGVADDQPSTTGKTLAWVLSMLGGVAVVFGILMVLL